MYREIISKYQVNRSYLTSIAVILACTFLLALLQPHEPIYFERNNSFALPELSKSSLSLLNEPGEPGLEIRARRLPQAIIIGARKCGTRALMKFLEVNPLVRSAPREVHFFDRDVNYRKGLEWYRSQMPETYAEQITLEKSPAYFITKGVPNRVKAMNPNIKLIVIFRDPVTRLISDYSQLIAKRIDTRPGADRPMSNQSQDVVQKAGHGKIQSDLWADAELEFKQHILRPDGQVDERRRLVRTGMYSMNLEKWLFFFPRKQFHFVDGERLITKPHMELQKLESFLEIKSMIEAKHFVFIPEKGFYCISNLNKTGLELEDELKESPMDSICLSRSKGRRHISIDDNLKRKLQDFYSPFNEYLSSLVGINFNEKQE